MTPEELRGRIVWVDAITPLGDTWTATWEALLRGDCASGPWRTAEAGYETTARVAEIAGLERGIDSDGKGAGHRLGSQLMERIAAAGHGAFAVYGAANHGDSDLVLALAASLDDPTAGGDSALWSGLLSDRVPHAFQPMLAGWSSSACSSGLHAVVDALMSLRFGAEPFAIASAVDALSAIGVAGFARAGACGGAQSRPFAIARDGLTIGEAAAAVCIGAGGGPALAVILGLGMSCDAWHPTEPEPSGDGLTQAIQRTIEDAGLKLGDVAAIVAHGTATKKNDAVEAAVIARLWPAGQPAVTSVKHSLGHPMGAAGLINLIVAAQASHSGLLPPVSPRHYAAEPGIDLITGSARAIRRGAPVLAMASGFGGNNVAVLVASETR